MTESLSIGGATIEGAGAVPGYRASATTQRGATLSSRPRRQVVAAEGEDRKSHEEFRAERQETSCSKGSESARARL